MDTDFKNESIAEFRNISRDILKGNIPDEELKAKLRQAQKMEVLGQLVGSVTHDFNNLLTIITGHCELMSEHTAVNDDMNVHLGEIRKAANIAAELTRQLLSFSRKESNEPDTININKTIENQERMIRLLLGDKRNLVLDLDSVVHTMNAIPGQIEQVIINLVVNARDAMSEKGTLCIKTKKISKRQIDYIDAKESEDYLLLEVSDDGCGMSRSIASKVFDPFFTTKGENQGTGLGLSIVKNIIDQMKGYITIDSEIGVGTTVQLYLPVVAGRVSSEIVKKTPAQTQRNNKLILLVEDEKGVAKMTEKMLVKYGYKVISASSGMDALQVCENLNDPPSVLLTDLVLPDMTGDHLAMTIREIWPELSVLLTSGQLIENEMLLFDNDDNYQFLPKPFKLGELISKVRVLSESTHKITAN